MFEVIGGGGLISPLRRCMLQKLLEDGLRLFSLYNDFAASASSGPTRVLARSSVFDGKTELAPPVAKRKRLSLSDIPSRRCDADTALWEERSDVPQPVPAAASTAGAAAANAAAVPSSQELLSGKQEPPLSRFLRCAMVIYLTDWSL